MNLTEAIIALLGAKFQGVRKDALTALAGVIALQVEDENEAKTIVDRMTAEKVNGFVTSFRSGIDREIRQSIESNERSLREKYNFVEKQQQQQQQQKQQLGALTLDQIKAVFAEQLNPLAQRMDAYETQRIADTRRETYVGKLKDAKLTEVMQNSLLQQFDRMTFKDDADFNQFLADAQPGIDKMAQEVADSALRGDRTPSMGKTDAKGVSQGMQDYIAAKGKNDGKVEGKALV